MTISRIREGENDANQTAAAGATAVYKSVLP